MKQRTGFTLVELVVVILILGILAGVAAPKMFNTSARATDNGLQQTLAIVRDAIELYSAENGGSLPPIAADGGTSFRAALQKYIRGDFPPCPVGAKNINVIEATGPVTAGVASPTDGWKFNSTTGEFICNYDAPSGSVPGTNYDDF